MNVNDILQLRSDRKQVRVLLDGQAKWQPGVGIEDKINLLFK